MKKRILLLFAILLVFIIALSYGKYSNITKRYNSKYTNIFIDPSYIDECPQYITNDSIHYFNTKLYIQKTKKTLKNKYNKATTTELKNEILKESSNFLYQNLADSLLPYWYGTSWDYNGISQKPGSGEIACGYFVFTALRDIGMKLPRIKMSQAASEKAIKALVSKNQIKRFSNKPLNEFLKSIKSWGNGFYIIGLDNHVGLFQVTEEESWFFHSTAFYPRCVIKEKASSSLALEYSSYRVVGKLSGYNTLTKKWLFSENINMSTD